MKDAKSCEIWSINWFLCNINSFAIKSGTRVPVEHCYGHLHQHHRNRCMDGNIPLEDINTKTATSPALGEDEPWGEGAVGFVFVPCR